MSQPAAAKVVVIACIALVPASTARRDAVLPTPTKAVGAFTAFATLQDTVPCSGTTWRRGRDDTATATTLTQFAAKMKALADSANALLAARLSEGADATPEFFTSAAEVARRGAAFAPDYVPSLLVAGQVALRVSTLGEARMDTVWGKGAECYAKRAVALAERQGDRTTATEARRLLRITEQRLADERRAAEAERRMAH
jgi:hypothetical protein